MAISTGIVSNPPCAISHSSLRISWDWEGIGGATQPRNCGCHYLKIWRSAVRAERPPKQLGLDLRVAQRRLVAVRRFCGTLYY